MCRLAAEICCMQSNGPGSLRMGLMDKLYNMNEHEAAAGNSRQASQGLHITEDETSNAA